MKLKKKKREREKAKKDKTDEDLLMDCRLMQMKKMEEMTMR